MADEKLSIEVRVALLEKQFEGYAPRDWVRELFKPTEATVSRMEMVVEGLAKDAAELFETHKEMLKEKGEADKKALEERTAMGLVKKYAPLVSMIVGILAVYRVLGTLAEVWLVHQGFVPK